MRLNILLLFLLCCSSVQAQKRMLIPSGCAFDTDVKNLNPYTFDADPQAQQIVGEICAAIGIQQKFQLQSADVKNALACERDGQRFILYNTDFLKEFQADARSKWAAYGVLAHEIGHHVNFHNFNEENPARRKELELEADRFSGFVLRSLGATKDEAKTAVSNLVNKTETATHPPPTARNLAVVNGWNDQDVRLRNMGVTGVNNPSGNNGNTTIVRDSDGDGIPDGQDGCPDVPGETLLKGCPDADGDGITDDEDACPYKKGETRWKGCPDTDDDGIPDNKDKCPYLRGELIDEGCPPADNDNDGIPNKTDRCPDKSGKVRYRGCPDTDGDGVPDPDDKCPNEKGDPNFEGCQTDIKQSTAIPDKKENINPSAKDLHLLITDENGLPISGANIDLSDCYGDKGKTNRDGKFYFDELLRPIDCNVSIHQIGYIDATIALRDFGKQKVKISLVKDTREDFHGYVFDEYTKAPIQKVIVQVQLPDGILETSTDSAGFYSFNIDPSVTYLVSYYKNGYVDAVVRTFFSSKDNNRIANVNLEKNH